MMFTFGAILVILQFQLIANEAQTDEELVELEGRLKNAISASNIPGAQVALINNGGVFWSYNFGVKNKETGDTVTSDTLFRVGSTTKTFVALAIMKLVNEGVLAIDTPLKEIAPEIKIDNPFSNEEPVRVVHLLEHTAGLDDMRFKNFYNESDPNISLLNAVNRDIGSLKVRWKPGTVHSYSNPSYGILGHIIEKITGQSFESYIDTNILKPLGMTNSSMYDTPLIERALSNGYDGKGLVSNRSIYLRSAGSLNSSAIELALMVDYLLNRGREGLIKSIDGKTITQMETPSTTITARAGLEFGYGLGIYQTKRFKYRWYGHSGTVDGYFSYYAYNPELGVGYALTANSSNSAVGAIIDEIVGFLTKKSEPSVITEMDGVLPEISGYYRIINDRNELVAGLSYITSVTEIIAKSNKLKFTQVLGGNSWEVTHVGRQKFVSKGEAVPSIMYTKTGGGSEIIESDGRFLKKINIFSAYIPIIITGMVLFAFILTILYFPVWVTNIFRGKIQTKQRVLLRAFPFASVLSLILAIFASSQLSLNIASKVNWQTLSIWSGTILFGFFGILASWQLVKSWRSEESLVARFLALYSSFFILIAIVYMIVFNYLGIMLWAW